MAKRVQRLGHGAATAATFIGLDREVTVDVSKQTLVVHNGVTAGGTPLALQNLSTTQEATTNTAGKMSSQQVTDLANVVAQAAQNATDIATNASDIATNTADIATRIPKMSGAGAGNTVVVASNGQDVEDGGYVSDPRFVSGTAQLFVQAAAPTNWSLSATHNDRVLRVVNTAGGGIGGSWTLSGISVQDTTLTIDQIPAHVHTIPFSGLTTTSEEAPADVFRRAGTGLNTGSVGGGQPHGHGINLGSSWRPAYVDAIICTRNA